MGSIPTPTTPMPLVGFAITNGRQPDNGWPGHPAKVFLLTGEKGSTPLPSAFTPMVKRTSRLASNEGFRVQLLVGVLLCRLPALRDLSRRDNPTGDGTRLEAGRAFEPCGFNSRSFR